MRNPSKSRPLHKLTESSSLQMALWWVMLGLALARIRAESLPDHIEKLPGVIKVKAGTLYAVEEYMQIKYSLEPLTRFRTDIENELQNIEAVAKTIDEDTVLSRGHKEMLTNATKNIISFAKWHPAYNIRRKRGLINIVGNIQHELFGIVDDRTLNQRLREFHSRMDTITHSYNASAAAINQIQHNMCQLKEAVIQLDVRVKGNMTDELSRFSQLTFFISNIRAKLQDLRAQRKHILQAMMEAARGTVSPTLITPLDIQNIIHTFNTETTKQTLFTPNLSPLFYASLSSYITPNGLSIVVPLKPAGPFTVHKLYPFPTEVNGVVKFATVKAEETVLTNASGALIIPHKPLNKMCRQPTENIFICVKPIWHISINSPSCERTIIFTPELIQETCTYNGLNTSDTPYFVPLGDITAIYFSTPTRVTTTCAHRNPTRTIQGTYILPNTCAITSKHLTLPASRSFDSSYRLWPSVWYPFTLKPTETLGREQNLNISWESMKQLDLVPGMVQNAAVDYVYPVGVSFLFLAVGTLVGILMMGKIYKSEEHRFRDIIGAIEAGKQEVEERLGRVHYRQENQDE